MNLERPTPRMVQPRFVMLKSFWLGSFLCFGGRHCEIINIHPWDKPLHIPYSEYRGFCWCQLDSQALPLVVYRQAAIHPFVHLHLSVDVAQPAIGGHYLQPVLSKAHHIIPTYGTLVFEAEHLIWGKPLGRLPIS